MSALCVYYTHIHTCNTQSQIIMHPKAKPKSAQSTDKPNEFKRQNSSQASKMKLLCGVAAAAAAAKSLQSRLTLCDPTDGSPPGSSVPGILRQEHWSGLPFPSPMHESEKIKVKLLGRVRLLETPWTAAHQAPPSMGFSRQEYWSGVPSPSPLCRVTYVLIHLKKKIYTSSGSFGQLWKLRKSRVTNTHTSQHTNRFTSRMNPTLTHSTVLLSTSYIPGTTTDPGTSDPNTVKKRGKTKKREGANEVQTFQLLSIPTMICMHQV